jgi:UDP-glucose 4-epimerase
MRDMIPPADRKSPVLVWGGLGFLGQHLVTRLLREGFEVSILCRSKGLYGTPAWAGKVRCFEIDNGASLDSNLLAAVSGASIIYNFAGWSGAAASNRDPLRSLDENCRMQLAFLTACQKAGHQPHIVFPSSWLVYARGAKEPLDEDHPTSPLSMYAAHKLCIESYLRIFEVQEHISYTVCRISNPYGFDQAQTGRGYKILNSFIQLALARKPIRIFGDGRQLRDFIYIDDVIQALLLCGVRKEARGQVFNISSGQSYSLIYAVETVIEILGPSPIVFESWPEDYRTAEPGDYVANITRARTRLGFHPEYDLGHGLRRTIYDYRGESATLAQGTGR